MCPKASEGLVSGNDRPDEVCSDFLVRTLVVSPEIGVPGECGLFEPS